MAFIIHRLGTSYLEGKRPGEECSGGCWHITALLLKPNPLARPCVTCVTCLGHGQVSPPQSCLSVPVLCCHKPALPCWETHPAEICREILVSLNITEPGPLTLCQKCSWAAPTNSSCELHPPLLIFRSYLSSIYHKPLAKQLQSFDKYSISPRIYWEDSWGSPHPSHTHCGLWNFKNICTGCVWAGCVAALVWITSSFSSLLQMGAALWLPGSAPLCVLKTQPRRSKSGFYHLKAISFLAS